MEETLDLVRRTVSGEVHAWSALQVQLDGMIVRMARHHRDLRRKGLAGWEDDLAEVRTLALERLATNDFHNLRAFIARSADAPRASSFESCIYGVVDFAIRDHLRKRPRSDHPAVVTAFGYGNRFGSERRLFRDGAVDRRDRG